MNLDSYLTPKMLWDCLANVTARLKCGGMPFDVGFGEDSDACIAALVQLTAHIHTNSRFSHETI